MGLDLTNQILESFLQLFVDSKFSLWEYFWRIIVRMKTHVRVTGSTRTMYMYCNLKDMQNMGPLWHVFEFANTIQLSGYQIKWIAGSLRTLVPMHFAMAWPYLCPSQKLMGVNKALGVFKATTGGPWRCLEVVSLTPVYDIFY